MVDLPTPPEQAPRQVPREHAAKLNSHDADVVNYQSPLESTIKLHSANIVRYGGLKRPNLDALELGGGPYKAFGFRAETVAAGNGHYTIIDSNQGIAQEAQTGIKKGLEANINVQVGNCNRLLSTLGIELGSKDVVVINSVNANATPRECRDMLEALRARQPQSEDVIQAATFLQGFIADKIPDNFPPGAPLHNIIQPLLESGEPPPEYFHPDRNAYDNILVLINAFLALKKGGKLVYAHNDRTTLHEATRRIRLMLSNIGFQYENTDSPGEGFYNTASQIVDMASLIKMVPSKFEMGMVTAEK